MVIDKLGGEVLHAPSIEIALELIDKHAPFNFVILDYMLEGDVQNGLEFCKRLRGGEFGPWGEMVGMRFVTGYEDQLAVAIQNSKVEQPPRVIQKPFDLGSTADLLHEIGDSAQEHDGTDSIFRNSEARQLLALICTLYEPIYRSKLPADEIADNLYRLFREGDTYALDEWLSWSRDLSPKNTEIFAEAAKESGCCEKVMDTLGLL